MSCSVMQRQQRHAAPAASCSAIISQVCQNSCPVGNHGGGGGGVGVDVNRQVPAGSTVDRVEGQQTSVRRDLQVSKETSYRHKRDLHVSEETSYRHKRDLLTKRPNIRGGGGVKTLM